MDTSETLVEVQFEDGGRILIKRDALSFCAIWLVDGFGRETSLFVTQGDLQKVWDQLASRL